MTATRATRPPNERSPDMFSARSKVAGGLLATVTASAGLPTPVSAAQAAYPHDLHGTLSVA